MDKTQILEIIKGFPTLAAMYGVMSASDKKSFEDKLIFASNNSASGDPQGGAKVQEVKPRSELIIAYPDNHWTNLVYLKMMGSYVGVYLLRHDIDFGQQVRTAALLRGIEITSLEYTETTKLRTTINDESPLDIENRKTNNPSDTGEPKEQQPTLPEEGFGSGSDKTGSEEGTGELFST